MHSLVKLAKFKKLKVHIIQTYNDLTKISTLDKTKLVTQNRLLDCGINKITEARTFHSENFLDLELKNSLKKSDLILIFGTLGTGILFNTIYSLAHN